MMNQIAVSTLCKEYTSDVIEWFNFHHAIGIDHFILYDNGSVPSLRDVFKDQISRGIVTVVDWSMDNTNGRQIRSQQHSLSKFKNFRWIAFIDTDEFIVLLEDELDIHHYLKKYSLYDGIALHWLVFGSNNHKNRQKSVIYNYTQCCPSSTVNRHIKSIINPQNYQKHQNPHFFWTVNGTVNVLKQPVCSALGRVVGTAKEDTVPILDSIMRINHYYTKSIEDFTIKQKRGGGNKVDREYTQNHFDHMHLENVYNDDIIILANKLTNQHKLL